MNSIPGAILAFVFVIALLVTVHEFGHFWVARRLGVKVLRFSIGFGRPLKRWQGKSDGTEYVIAALPLGGYVRMLDEREGPVDESELDRAFNRQALWRRFAIVLAGPLSNFLLAIVVYALVFMIGVTGIKPITGTLDPGGLAASGGFEAGDLIMRVGDKPVRSWDEAFLAIMAASLDRQDVPVRVLDAARNERLRQLDFSHVEGDIDRANLMSFIGMRPYRPDIPAVIGAIEPASPADRAGLEKGDRVTAIGDRPVVDWPDWVTEVRKNPGQTMVVHVERQGQPIELALTPETRKVKDGTSIGRIGAAVDFPEARFDALKTTVRYMPPQAIWSGIVKTKEMTLLTLRMLAKMIFGEVSVKNLSGPISIASYAGQSAGMGLTPFMEFIALISISLGVLNLLPVPVLDGGHLFFYLIEAIKGSPVSPAMEMFGQRLGIAAILSLMVLAFYNDLVRVLG